MRWRARSTPAAARSISTALNERYHGKKVWVIDRDKIRRRVAQVVDAALALSHLHDEGAGETRERVNSAIQAMFNDNRNLASERNADSIAGVRFNGGPAERGVRTTRPHHRPRRGSRRTCRRRATAMAGELAGATGTGTARVMLGSRRSWRAWRRW